MRQEQHLKVSAHHARPIDHVVRVVVCPVECFYEGEQRNWYPLKTTRQVSNEHRCGGNFVLWTYTKCSLDRYTSVRLALASSIVQLRLNVT